MTRVLLVPSDPKLGTDYYRCTLPFSRIPNVQISLPQGGEFNWTVLANIDVIFVQRPAVPHNIHILEIAKKCRIPILLDYDDDPFNLDKSNPVYDIWEKDYVKASVREALRLADITMTSTSHLKDVLLEQVPTADIRVVPNAIDDKTFSFEPSYIERTKTILLRGAGSHSTDWKIYKDAIIDTLKAHPDYKLVVMGLTPEWLSEIPENQLDPFKFVDLPTYFDNLMQIRPEIAIVPLEDTKFNRSKSAIALYEGVIAGAAVTATALPEFYEYLAFPFRTSDQLKINLEALIQNPKFREDLYHKQLQTVPKLSQVNEIRRDILEELTLLDKRLEPYTLPKRTATDLEFHEYALSHAHTQDDRDYDTLHKKTAEWIMNNINPSSAIELGFGTGATLLHLLKNGVNAYGLEINPYSFNYFIERYPVYQSQVKLADITTEPLELDVPGDLVYSFEVFEHLDKSDEWFEEYLLNLSKNFKNFYFSSTPYADTEYFEAFWGHIGVRKTSTWIKIFEKSGWKFKSNPKAIVEWDLWFTSKSFT